MLAVGEGRVDTYCDPAPPCRHLPAPATIHPPLLSSHFLPPTLLSSEGRNEISRNTIFPSSRHQYKLTFKQVSPPSLTEKILKAGYKWRCLRETFPIRWRWRFCVETLVYHSVLIDAFSDCCKIYREALINTFTILSSLLVAAGILISKQCFTLAGWALGTLWACCCCSVRAGGNSTLYSLYPAPTLRHQTPNTPLLIRVLLLLLRARRTPTLATLRRTQPRQLSRPRPANPGLARPAAGEGAECRNNVQKCRYQKYQISA